MARVSYIDETDDFEMDELVEKIKAGRRGSLINVYKLLLHSPPLASLGFGMLMHTITDWGPPPGINPLLGGLSPGLRIEQFAHGLLLGKTRGIDWGKSSRGRPLPFHRPR